LAYSLEDKMAVPFQYFNLKILLWQNSKEQILKLLRSWKFSLED